MTLWIPYRGFPLLDPVVHPTPVLLQESDTALLIYKQTKSGYSRQIITSSIYVRCAYRTWCLFFTTRP